LSFPKKLWQLVESDEFKTIWWGHCGNCIVIDEEMFKVEVLGRTRPPRVFETESMKSFIRQLNLYGFTKMQGDFQRSAWLPEFLAEDDAFSAHRKLLLYYNPNFKRDYPHLLENCKRR
ncbi:HSFY1 protein, partial [Anseranas semipalmata]|nr:HSFY1 protein [Anseranas semipalmata]